jgi:hypothetical protein
VTDTLERAADQLLSRVAHWSASRWAVDSRADRVFALVQDLADLAADAESRDRLPVPRLADLVLPDQLRVMVLDLRDAPAESRAAARAAIETLRPTL